MGRSSFAAAASRAGAWLLPFALALAPAGCGGGFHVEVGGPIGHDHPHKPDKPDAPQLETGIFLIAGDLCTTCTGSVDDRGSAARFNQPAGLAADGNGNLYVAEPNSSTIRKVTEQGVVTTIAGAVGAPGNVDGTGTAARLNAASNVAADPDGNVYVSDTGNRTIRKITPGGVVTTLAGSPGACGHADGTAALARFCEPQGIAIDRSGNLLVADSGNHTIRKIDPAGRVTTVAGANGACGSTDGEPAAARFCQPHGITVDRYGDVYVADTANSTVRMIRAGGRVSTIAGRANECGSADGAGSNARLCHSRGIAVDDEGDLYVSDTGNSTIRRIDLDNVVSTAAGVAGQGRVVLGPLPGALNAPRGIAVTGSTGVLAVTTQNLVLKVVPSR